MRRDRPGDFVRLRHPAPTTTLSHYRVSDRRGFQVAADDLAYAEHRHELRKRDEFPADLSNPDKTMPRSAWGMTLDVFRHSVLTQGLAEFSKLPRIDRICAPALGHHRERYERYITRFHADRERGGA